MASRSYGKGLRALSITTVLAMTAALALVFFYAPLEADQGFIQKIFYLHVPLAIVALFGFVAGGVYGIFYLRPGDDREDRRVARLALRILDREAQWLVAGVEQEDDQERDQQRLVPRPPQAP